MRRNYRLPWVLLMALLLTACGGDGPLSNDGETGREETPASNAGEPAGVAVPASGYWANWLAGVSDGPFERAGGETFSLEHNGYAVELAIDIWAGARGTGDYMLHPANPQIPLPAFDSTTCVIPFVITATTTTKDDSFLTDYRLRVSSNLYYADKRLIYDEENPGTYYHELVYGIDLSYFERQLESKEEWLAKQEARQSQLDDETISKTCTSLIDNTWQQSSTRNSSGTGAGEEQTYLGCFVIENYYSPNHPDGNADMISDIGACLWIDASVEGSSEERFMVTMLEK